jgi:hypothetical protein
MIGTSGGLVVFVMSPPVMEGGNYDIFCGLSDSIAFLTSSSITVADLDPFLVKITRSLYKFERGFPPTEHAIVFHLLYEIFLAVKRLGPTYYYWTYVFERFLGGLCRKMHDRARPEKNLLNIHLIELALDRIPSAFPDLLTGLPPRTAAKHLSRVKSAYTLEQDVGDAPLVSYSNRCIRIQLSPQQLRSIVAITPGSSLSLIEEIYQGDLMQFYDTARVKSSESGRVSLRRTSLSDGRRKRKMKSSSLYSFLCDVSRRASVVCAEFFCSFLFNGSRFELAWSRVFPVGWEMGMVAYFQPDNSVMKFVSCEHFGGVVGRGFKAESADKAFVFSREDTLSHSYTHRTSVCFCVCWK